MDQSSKQAASHTQALSGFAQLLTGIGFVVIIIGAVVLGLTLIGELSSLGSEDEELRVFEFAAVVGSATTMIYGFMITALGQVLSCIRSMTINVAKLVEQGNN
ncbi:MAG: hypothetical protein CMJ29_01375 [Phycisphaerae bacterium]|nr:hypothetical protein [Phycisphaerae bacterium]|tara:strand:- start:2858 stop:3166 length:309 start_codon:yes stop_codon:yes gene_type:complete